MFICLKFIFDFLKFLWYNNIRKRGKSLMKKLGKVFTIICITLIMWLVLSWVDINAHNSTDEDYASWNYFNIFDKGE
jgi:branched-subunit amino acid permease